MQPILTALLVSKKQAARVGSHKGETSQQDLLDFPVGFLSDSEAAMMMGSKNPTHLAPQTDCLDSRITAMKSKEKVERTNLGKTGKRPRGKMRVRSLSYIPKGKFMQVVERYLSPSISFLVKLRVRKNALGLQNQYVSKCPTSTRPHPTPQVSSGGKCPRNCLPSPIPPSTPNSSRGICLWFPTSPQRRDQ